MITNTSSRYGLIAIALHWLMAVGIFGMFGLGLYMVELTYYDSWYHGSLEFHKASGVLLALVFLARLLWRQINTVPTGLSDKKIENQAAHLVHLGLYLVMAALFVSGYLISTADGRAVDVFGVFSVPATLTDRGSQEEIAGKVHELLAWLLIGMVALHALAALKHQLINRDNTLKRMLRP
ncbi:cytochrome b [Candidatus Thalassolituus haligoni]|uniref:cytochrome b n=1 Tax=Candidatus Thalassolituus haligoni TaxID=3100113 RepID=UPI003513BA3B|tara:strand:- start:9243 stop:9782 length:540 start_codon:yes stop_codon:yes gene_type:complete